MRLIFDLMQPFLSTAAFSAYNRMHGNLFDVKGVFFVLKENRGCKSDCFAITLGLILGVLTALAWYFEYINYVSVMMPYAFVLAVIILITTAVFKFVCSCAVRESAEDGCFCPACFNVNCRSKLIFITAAIFIAFALLVMATYFSFPGRAVLSFVGSISFWIMLFSFIDMLSFSFRRHS